MEAKEKLLKLINACVDNKEFYKENGENQLIIDYKVRYRFNDIDLEYDYKRNSMGFNSKFYENYSSLREKLMKSISDEGIETYNKIIINFIDEPPITFQIRRVEKQRKPLDTCLIETSETIVDIVETKGFWGVKKNTFEKFKEVEVKPFHVVNEYVAKIAFNSITCEISMDEYKDIGDRIQGNVDKFKTENDMDKLEERIQKFSK